MIRLYKIFCLIFVVSNSGLLQAGPNCEVLSEKLLEKNWLIEIPESSLELKEVHKGASGANNDGVYQGAYRGEDIVVKKILPGTAIELQLIYTEIKLYYQLSRRDFSPRFYGVMRFKDGAFGLVSKKIKDSWIARHSYQKDNGIPDAVSKVSLSTRKKWYSEMENIVRKLTESKIHMFDMQFILSPDGRAYLIDMEAYSRKEDPQVLNENMENLRDFQRQLLK